MGRRWLVVLLVATALVTAPLAVGARPAAGSTTMPRSRAAAVAAAMRSGALTVQGGRFRPNDAVSADEFAAFCRVVLGSAPQEAVAPRTHGEALRQLAALL